MKEKKSESELIHHARIIIHEASLRGVQGPIYLLLEDLAKVLERRLTILSEELVPSVGTTEEEI